MSKRVTFSGDMLSIGEIWNWHEISKKSILEYKNSIRSSVLNEQPVPEYFIGKNFDEIDDFFEKHFEELDRLVSFNLLSSAEAILKIEYLRRVYNKDRDSVSREFRKLYKRKGKTINFEEDLLNIWSKEIQNASAIISDFRGCLKFRHWLAHGRFWIPKFGRKYNAAIVFSIIQGILTKLPLKYYRSI